MLLGQIIYSAIDLCIFLFQDFSPYYVCNNRDKNIYTILSLDVLPNVLRQPKRFEKKTLERADKLKQYCERYTNTEFEGINNAFSRFRF